MRIALIAPPFIPVPPVEYGGTELFIAQLGEGLRAEGIEVVVYANGESTVGVETRWRYRESQWPIRGEGTAMLFPIQWNEPFGLVMVEAMACGTPVLALRGGSVPEVVRDGVSGYLCRST